MQPKTPEQVQTWFDQNLHKMDLPQQWLGDEPNSRRKPWDDAAVRWCLVASWVYEAAAGNSSIPAVYSCVNDARADFLADRAYLPATPRDLRLLDKAGIGIVGVESRRQLREFHVIGTSIAYPVLSMSWVKMLSMSGIPIRWADRGPETGNDPGQYPMVMAGGLSYGAPEALAPVVDCWWLGEVEDETGADGAVDDTNPGIGAVCARIADFTATGAWTTDRIGCYAALAREFRFLYFPRFVAVDYAYTDRSHVGVGPHLSKQVVGYRSLLAGMRMPLLKRHVRNLDDAKPLVAPPLLYADPAMGSGDLEVGRGCPAWCSFCALCLSGDTQLITRRGVERLDALVGQTVEVWNSAGWQTATVDQHGVDNLDEIEFAPAFWDDRRASWIRSSSKYRRVHRATALHRWPLAVGGETHHLAVGDVVRAEYVEDDSSGDYAEGWVHGLTFGDGTRENSRIGDRSNSYAVLVRAEQADEMLPRLERLRCGTTRNHRGCGQPVCVLSVTQVKPNLFRVRMNSRTRLKEFPSSTEFMPAYVRGFIEGWDAADGSSRNRRHDRLRIFSQHPQAREWLEANAAYGGWLLTGSYVKPDLVTNLGGRQHPVQEYGLSRAAAWQVVSIEKEVIQDGVYCATVEGDEFFTLASGILTGNTYRQRQKPYRQRSVDNVLSYAKEFQRNMGSVRMAPFSPDFPMYTQRKKLIAALLEQVSDEVDAPAMRVDDFIADTDFILLQVHGGMDAVTLGVEGNSQRMRDLVGKGTADADIHEAVTRAIRAGIRKIKLFMISNLPGEDEGDVFRILKLAKDLADIRESMNQPTVRIQFSWTPLMIEANTPMQWFAPPVPNRILGDVWEEFRDLKIDFKLGAKSETNKAAFFQLCQRASRDVGEALVDAMEAVDQACWGGVPRTFKDLLEDKLKARGFRNGYGDCFDERDRTDLFGWEFIDQGISVDLLWRTYLQMREFVEQTDSHGYDTQLDTGYHGAEWIDRCDVTCHGKKCGACNHADLKIRTGYIRAAQTERHTDLTNLRPVDQRSQAIRIRARILRPESHRFVGNDHWRFAIRRAAFRAQHDLKAAHGISKRSIRFASDACKYRDWTCGVDYVEFALTRRVDLGDVAAFLSLMNAHLKPWLAIGEWNLHPAGATTMRADVDRHLFELPLTCDAYTAFAAVRRFHASRETGGHVPMRLKIDAGYFAPASEEVNAHDHVEDLWLARDGARLVLRMLIHGRPSPYNVHAALFGQPSWINTARTPAWRLDAFITADRTQQDFLRPNCADCGLQIPTNVLDRPYHPDRCPQCLDRHQGLLLKELTFQ